MVVLELGGRLIRGSDGKLYFSEKGRDKMWKAYVEMSSIKKIVGIIMWKCSKKSSRLCMQR